MDAEKRKREDHGERQAEGSKRVRGDQAASVSASEEEVEEFFAILRRIHVAVKYLRRSEGERWRESLDRRKEDGVLNGGDVDRVDARGGDEDYSGLDLNSDPAEKPKGKGQTELDLSDGAAC